MRKLTGTRLAKINSFFFFSLLHPDVLSTMPSHSKVSILSSIFKETCYLSRMEIWKVILIEWTELNRILRTTASLNLSTWRTFGGVSFWKHKSTFWPKPRQRDPYFHFLTSRQLWGSSSKILSPAWLVRHWWKSFTVYFKEKIYISESDIRSILKYTGKLRITHSLPMSSHIF